MRLFDRAATVATSGTLPSPLAHKKRWLLLPIIFFLSYLTLTVVIFAVGPWPYPVGSPTRLYAFLAAAHISLGVGYLAGLRVRPAQYTGHWSATQIVKWSVFFNLVLLVPTIAFRTGGALPDLAAAIADPGAAYSASGYLRETELPVVEYIRFVCGPILAMLLPLSVFYWSSLTAWVRLGALGSLGGIAFLFLAMGTNKALADMVLVAPTMLMAGIAARQIKLGLTSKAATVIVFALAATLFLGQFANTQASRVGSAAKHAYMPGTRQNADLRNFMVSGLPEGAQVGVLGLTAYLTMGYYALDLSLEKAFVPMYGAGNSMFLFRQAARLTGDTSWLDSAYPMRIEVDGWSGYGLFSSIYPWIASDVGFPGTILVVFAIGFLFAVSWRDTLDGVNPFAVAMFAQFVIMLLYFSANNQCLQSGEGWSAFWMTGVVWLWTRRGQRPVAVRLRVER